MSKLEKVRSVVGVPLADAFQNYDGTPILIDSVTGIPYVKTAVGVVVPINILTSAQITALADASFAALFPAAFTAAADAADLRPITQMASQNTTSGTAINFTGIPSFAKKVNVMWSGVSTSGVSSFLIQIGDAGGIETTGYVTSQGTVASGPSVVIANRTDGWSDESGNAAATRYGLLTLVLLNAATFTWAGKFMSARGDTAVLHLSSGVKSLSAVLDRVRITTGTGTDTFDAGIASVSYE